MHLSNAAEEILETLWIEKEERHHEESEITLLRDNPAFAELVKHRLVAQNGNRVKLTETGLDEAAGCIRRHRLAERLLNDVLRLRGANMHETSCQFEHLLHRGLDENICTLLGHPRTCPHGKTIPEGRCCREARQQTGKLIHGLDEIPEGQSGTIAYLQTRDRAALQKLLSMGALPMTRIRVIQRSPSIIFEIGKSQFAVDHELASHVFVRTAG